VSLCLLGAASLHPYSLTPTGISLSCCPQLISRRSSINSWASGISPIVRLMRCGSKSGHAWFKGLGSALRVNAGGLIGVRCQPMLALAARPKALRAASARSRSASSAPRRRA
jgi:hypothetical protein